jgi:hypothetical protein
MIMAITMPFIVRLATLQRLKFDWKCREPKNGQ